MATATQDRDTQREVVMRQGNGAQGRERQPRMERMEYSQLTMEDVQAQLEQQLQTALEQAIARPASLEVAEPQGWWNLYAIGPIQPGAGLAGPFAGPLLPHQVIRTNERAYVATVLILNPFGPGSPSAMEILSNFALPYEVTYGTGELQRWQPGPANLQHTGSGNLTPGSAFAIDVFSFTAQDEGLYQMNVSARIYGCEKNIAPPFAGFARAVIDIDPDLFFFPAPGLQVDQPIRFQVYR